HCCFGAAVDHSDLFNRRHPPTDQVGQFHFQRIRNSETKSTLGGIAHRIDYHFRSVTENVRPPAADVVDIFLSVDIPNPGASGPLDEKWFATNIAKRAHRRIDSGRNSHLSTSKQIG